MKTLIDLGIAAMVVTLIIVLTNINLVPVSFLQWSFNSSLALLILAPLLLGFAVGGLMGIRASARGLSLGAANQKQIEIYGAEMGQWKIGHRKPESVPIEGKLN